MQFNIPAARGFSRGEYAARCQNLQQQMAEKNIDLLLFTTEVELAYCCGFLTPFWKSPTRPWFLLLPAQGKPLAVAPTIGEALMRECYVSDVRTWASPHPSDDGVSLLAQTILDIAGKRRVNMGMMRKRQSTLRMPPADFDALCAMLPNVELQDVSDMVQQARMIKSPAEIDKIATACNMVSDVFAHWQEWLQEKMTMRDIFRQFKIHCLNAGIDDVAYLAGGMDCDGYSDVISPPNERLFAAGDILMLDSGCLYDYYYCDFNRNIACCRAGDRAFHCYETLWQATEAGINAAKAGTSCKQLFEAMHAVIVDAGFANEEEIAGVGRYGHGLGLEITETPSVAAWDTTLLSPGMVITLEPSALIADDKLLVHEENIVIDETGHAHLLTRRAPKQLPLLAS